MSIATIILLICICVITAGFSAYMFSCAFHNMRLAAFRKRAKRLQEDEE